MEQFILDASESMWNKEGHFIWGFNWEAANAEFDTDNDDKQQEELSIGPNYLELDAEKWPVYFTETYYSGDGRGPQESDSSAGYGEFPFSYLPVIEDTRILEHLNHGAALNAPSLGRWHESICQFSSMLVPEPETERVRFPWDVPNMRFSDGKDFVIPTCHSTRSVSHVSDVTESDILHPLQGILPTWLLLRCIDI
jgi:hypothetical protein